MPSLPSLKVRPSLRWLWIGSAVLGALALPFGATATPQQATGTPVSSIDGFNPNTNGTVTAVAHQADGRIIIGGTFTQIQPATGTFFWRNHLARLNPDGSVDTTFDPNLTNVTAGAVNNAAIAVYSIVVQPDGKILVGGSFNTVAPNQSARTAAGKPRVSGPNSRTSPA